MPNTTPPNYPPGVSESSPDAPWNQVPTLDPDEVQSTLAHACELWDYLSDLKDTDASWFGPYQYLAKALSSCQTIIDGLTEVRNALIDGD
jgi:hypothetical protein